MNAIEEKCKKKGVRLTDQRRIIAQAMAEAKDHPDVDELHKRVTEVDRKISIATVYRTVKLCLNRFVLVNVLKALIFHNFYEPQLNLL